MEKLPTIKSKYNSKEKFSFKRVPSSFRSVTEKSINNIKSYCSNKIAKSFNDNFDPQALYAMVGTVVGNFDLLESRLIQDYSSRKDNLKKAQNRGIKKASEALIMFENTVAAHELSLKRYNDNMIDYDGNSLDEKLHYDRNRLIEFKNRLKKIEENNHEA